MAAEEVTLKAEISVTRSGKNIANEKKKKKKLILEFPVATKIPCPTERNRVSYCGERSVQMLYVQCLHARCNSSQLQELFVVRQSKSTKFSKIKY